MQALLQVIPAEDVAFVPATKEIVVSKRGDETIGVVFGFTLSPVYYEGRSRSVDATRSRGRSRGVAAGTTALCETKAAALSA